MLKIEKWVEEKQTAKRLTFVKFCLYVASCFYKLLVSARHLFYDFKLIKTKKGSIPIVSIGNIVCGGTGKSEFVSKLIQDLGRDDLAVLTRGYRSKRKGESRVVADADDGDEPFMLQSRHKGIPVIVGKKREVSAKLAKSLGAKLAILDDGMQYLKLEKDLQVVMIRASDPFGSGFVPFGMRREILKKLRDVDYIVVHGASTPEKYELVKNSMMSYSSAKCFGTRYCLNKNKEIIRKKVGVFCGIGNPQAFMEGLAKLDVTVIEKVILSDHQKFINIVQFYQRCINSGADAVVCTTKDYVKLNAEEQKLVTPIQISMEVLYDNSSYEALINQINNNIIK